MKTIELKRALRLCQGSLMSAELVPVLTHFCFQKDSVHAYNDITAVVASIGSKVTCGVRGDTLMGVLETLKGTTDFSLEKDTLVITSGDAEVKLTAVLPKEDFLFKNPLGNGTSAQRTLVADLQLVMTAALARGLEFCRQTVGVNAMQREFTGVAIFSDGEGKVTIYSTDDVRMSRYSVHQDNISKWSKKPRKFLLPEASVKQLLDVWKQRLEDEEESYEATLCFSKDWCWMAIKGATFFSKLMPDTPPDYPAMFQRVLPEKPAWVAKPQGLTDAIARAVVLTARDQSPEMILKVENKALTCLVQDAALGSFQETFTSNIAGKIEFAAVPEKIRPLTEDCDRLFLSKECMGFKRGLYTCLVSPLGKEEE